MNWLQLVRDVSILIGTWIAVYGIDSWRREHTGKRRLELAEDTLASFYEARDAIQHMRSPVSFGAEVEDVKRGENESEKSWEARRNASVILKRYNQHQELFNKLHATRYRFMAQIGKEESQPFEDFRKLLNEITSSAHVLARLWARDYFRNDEHFEKHRTLVEKYEAIFWEGIVDKDPVNPKLDLIINNIEKTCSNVISGEGTLYSLININFFKKKKMSQ